MLNKAIKRAYRRAQENGYESIYWALDLHGTCIVSTYSQHQYQWINPACKDALQYLSAQNETKLIIWSSLHNKEIPNIVDFFRNEGINVFFVNENPMEPNTEFGCFDRKFYMSVIVDDKAGFDPEDWPELVEHVKAAKLEYGFH